jgi:hypothetical protein
MPAVPPVFHTLRRKVRQVAGGVRACSQERLALLAAGVALADAGVAGSEEPASVERLLRRALDDGELGAARCCEPLLNRLVDWAACCGPAWPTGAAACRRPGQSGRLRGATAISPRRSPMPRRIALRDSPVARATALIPPCPTLRASLPATARRARSSARPATRA